MSEVILFTIPVMMYTSSLSAIEIGSDELHHYQ